MANTKLVPTNYPATEAYDITPDNDNDLSTHVRGVYIGGAGALKVDMVGVGTVTFSTVPAGSIWPIAVKRVYATGTTATNLIGLR